MFKLSKLFLSFLIFIVSSASYAESSAIDGDFSFHDTAGVLSITGTYSGDIDISNQSGTFTSTSAFLGSVWEANVQNVYVYDEVQRGVQNYSWDITKQTWFDSSTGLLSECYVEAGNCEVLRLNANMVLLGEQVVSYPFAMNQSGQFVVATFINWSTNVIPNLMTLQSLSATFGSIEFESFDGDNDGVPGYAMLNPPFPGQTLSITGVIGLASGISVSDIAVEGGTLKECGATNGSNVSASVVITAGNDPIDSIQWLLNGAIVGSGEVVNTIAPLGQSELTVIATTVGGQVATSTVSVSVTDTTAPVVSVQFIDSSTGQVVTTVNQKSASKLVADYSVTDVCDASPAVVASGGFDIDNLTALPIRVFKSEVILDVAEIKVFVIATDSSGNNQLSSASLIIQ